MQGSPGHCPRSRRSARSEHLGSSGAGPGTAPKVVPVAPEWYTLRDLSRRFRTGIEEVRSREIANVTNFNPQSSNPQHAQFWGIGAGEPSWR
eukprot:6469526-Alexandrium_andersonii.AAC.1